MVVSAPGCPFTMFPATVPTFLIWGDPSLDAPSPRAAAFSRIREDSAIRVWVARHPILIVPLSRIM